MRRIAILNQKGGVGKTTTTVNLSAALAAIGRRVCVLDLDPQAHATTHLGLEPDGTLPSMYDVLVSNKPLAVVRREADANLWLCPADINLAAAEVELAGVVGREVILREALAADEQHTTPPRWGGVAGVNAVNPAGVGIDWEEDPTPGLSAPVPIRPLPSGEGCSAFDYMLMDCGPSLGVLTLNALAAADEVFIPLQPHFLALHGLSKLLETTALVSRRINPKLKVTGVVVCLFDGQTKLAQEVVNDLRAFLDKSRNQPVPWADARVFDTKVRRNVKLAECPSHGTSIFRYAPTCPGATDYAALANEVVGAVDVGEMNSAPSRTEELLVGV